METTKNLQPENDSKIARINPVVFFGGALICILFYAPMAIWPEASAPVIQKLMHVLTYNLDWLWELSGVAALLFSLWLAFGRYGNVKLGGPDEKPEFSTFSWIAMMISGCVGSSVIYWASLEPLYYLSYPPFGIEPMSAAAAQWSLAYGIFHWGPLIWAIYVPTTLAFAYMYYVRKKPYLYPSYACRGVLGDMVDGWVGKAIDMFILVGLVGGVGTALGVNVPMISAAFAHMLGLEDTIMVKVIVACIWTLIFGYSSYKGLYSGIKKLSEINTWACIGLVVFVLLAGPTIFMLSLYFDNLGVLMTNFFRMSLYTDPVAKSGFPQDWTVFYLAWVFAWAIAIGLFFTRISRGRTIKALVLNIIFSATLGCSFFYLTFGGFAVSLQLESGVNLAETLSTLGGPAVIVQMLEALPFTKILIPIFILISLIFQATSIDSNAYTMAMIGCHEIKDEQEPPRWARAWWAGMLVFVCVALMLVGGLKVVQLSSVLTSVPIMFIEVILALSLVKWLNEDFGEKCRPPIQTIDYTEDEEDKKKIS